MFTFNNTIQQLKLNDFSAIGLYEKVGITFPIEWQIEDRAREIKYYKIYNIPVQTNSPQGKKSITRHMSYSINSVQMNPSFSSTSSTPVRQINEQSSTDTIFIQNNLSAIPSAPTINSNTNDRQKKSRGLTFFQKKITANNSLQSPYMIEADDNLRKLILNTPGLPHSIRRCFWFCISGGFKLSMQFIDAWDNACHSATNAAQSETNLPLAEANEFDAFLGGRIDTLTFLPPAIQLQISTFLHVFSHAHFGTVEFAPMISTAASLLLLYLEPKLAYLSLTAMVNRSKVDNGFYFILSKAALLAESSVFRFLCEKLFKNLVRHADSIKVNMEAFHLALAPMLFFPFISLPSALTLFDLFLVEGRKIILQFSLALLQSEERNLMQSTDSDGFVEVIVNALDRLSDANAMKNFLLKNVQKVDVGKWHRIVAMEQSFLDPANKKMTPFVIAEDDRAFASFEQRIAAENQSDNCDDDNEEENEEEMGMEIDLDGDFIVVNKVSLEKPPSEILNSNSNSNSNINTNLRKKPSNSDLETDSLLALDTSNRVERKQHTSQSYPFRKPAVGSFDQQLRRRLLDDGSIIEFPQKNAARTVNFLPSVHGGRLLTKRMFFQIRSRLPSVFRRFSCQLVFAKSLNGGSLENLISSTVLTYTPSLSSTVSVLSSSSSIMFSSGNLNLFEDNFDENNSNRSEISHASPHIVVIESLSGKVFGALIGDPIKYESGDEFFGRKELSLVFDASAVKIFQLENPPNNDFIRSSPEILQIGGPMPAIRINKDLSAVESCQCETFASPSLISGDEDEATDNIVEIEVYRLKNLTKKPMKNKFSAKMV